MRKNTPDEKLAIQWIDKYYEDFVLQDIEMEFIEKPMKFLNVTIYGRFDYDESSFGNIDYYFDIDAKGNVKFGEVYEKDAEIDDRAYKRQYLDFAKEVANFVNDFFIEGQKQLTIFLVFKPEPQDL